MLPKSKFFLNSSTELKYLFLAIEKDALHFSLVKNYLKKSSEVDLRLSRLQVFYD